MTIIGRILETRPRLFAGALALVSAGLLATVFIMQYGFGLEPCPLCVWQRYPHGAVIAAGIIGALMGGRAARWLIAAAGLAFLVTAGIGGFQVGVEQHWWEGLASCTGGAGVPGSLEELQAQLGKPPSPRCDEVPWSLFGISLAGYNLLVSLAIACLAIARALRPERLP
ncbi:MAG: disulfide bond formation protein B [Alphaproteobacteria bacterium]